MIMSWTQQDRQVAAAAIVEDGRWLGRLRDELQALLAPVFLVYPTNGVVTTVKGFEIIVIGGLGSMRGALVGALIVGLIRAYSIVLYPELEVLAIYAIVIAVLLLRPAGLFGRPVA